MLLVSLLLATLAAAQVPQDQPDFSGRWVLVEPQLASPDIARAITVGQSLVRTNVRGEPMTPSWSNLVVQREFADGVRSDSYRIGVSGGRVDVAPPDSEQTSFSVRWKGSQLVIETSRETAARDGPGSRTVHTEAWSFDEQRGLVITITDTRSGAEPVTRMLTYRRQDLDHTGLIPS